MTLTICVTLEQPVAALESDQPDVWTAGYVAGVLRGVGLVVHDTGVRLEAPVGWEHVARTGEPVAAVPPPPGRDTIRMRVLEVLADAGGTWHGSVSDLLRRAGGATGSSSKVGSRLADAGLIEVDKLNHTQARAVHLTDDGWSLIGRQRPEIEMPDAEVVELPDAEIHEDEPVELPDAEAHEGIPIIGPAVDEPRECVGHADVEVVYDPPAENMLDSIEVPTGLGVPLDAHARPIGVPAYAQDSPERLAPPAGRKCVHCGISSAECRAAGLGCCPDCTGRFHRERP
jgi:hypothetical protein